MQSRRHITCQRLFSFLVIFNVIFNKEFYFLVARMKNPIKRMYAMLEHT